MALTTGGTSILGDAAAATCGCASGGVASVRFDRFGAKRGQLIDEVGLTDLACRRLECGDVRRLGLDRRRDGRSRPGQASRRGRSGASCRSRPCGRAGGSPRHTTLLTSFAARWPGSGLLTSVRTRLGDGCPFVVARGLDDLGDCVVDRLLDRVDRLDGIAGRWFCRALVVLPESGLFSAGFADCDVLAPPSPSDSVCATAVPAPASIPTVTPAHTAPAPSQSKNRSTMPSPVPRPPVTLIVDARFRRVFTDSARTSARRRLPADCRPPAAREGLGQRSPVTGMRPGR